MKVLKHNLFLVGVALVGVLVAFPGTAMAATEKDASLRLNVMNLDCTVDQILEGNSPTYIVNPAGCYVPPVIESISTKPMEKQKEAPVEAFFTEPFIFTQETVTTPDSYGPVPAVPNELPTYPKDAVPVTPVSSEMQAGSVLVTSVAVGSTIVASTIIVDVLIFNSQLVNASVSIGRRIFQFIISIVAR